MKRKSVRFRMQKLTLIEPKTLVESIAVRKNAYKIAELAVILNCSKQKLYDMVDGGHIPFFRVGAMIRFDPKLIAAWLEQKQCK
jgi:excisionase family DNA binding protein